MGIGKKRANQPGYVQKTNAQGRKYWAREDNAAQEYAKQAIRDAGIGYSIDDEHVANPASQIEGVDIDQDQVSGDGYLELQNLMFNEPFGKGKYSIQGDNNIGTLTAVENELDRDRPTTDLTLKNVQCNHFQVQGKAKAENVEQINSDRRIAVCSGSSIRDIQVDDDGLDMEEYNHAVGAFNDSIILNSYVYNGSLTADHNSFVKDTHIEGATTNITGQDSVWDKVIIDAPPGTKQFMGEVNAYETGLNNVGITMNGLGRVNLVNSDIQGDERIHFAVPENAEVTMYNANIRDGQEVRGVISSYGSINFEGNMVDTKSYTAMSQNDDGSWEIHGDPRLYGKLQATEKDGVWSVKEQKPGRGNEWIDVEPGEGKGMAGEFEKRLNNKNEQVVDLLLKK